MADVDNKSVLSREAVELLLKGERLRGFGISVDVEDSSRVDVDLSFHITDDNGDRLARFAKATIERGGSLTLLSIDRAFNFTLSGG